MSDHTYAFNIPCTNQNVNLYLNKGDNGCKKPSYAYAEVVQSGTRVQIPVNSQQFSTSTAQSLISHSASHVIHDHGYYYVSDTDFPPQETSSSASGEVCKQDCHDHAYSCIHVSQTKADEICTPPNQKILQELMQM